MIAVPEKLLVYLNEHRIGELARQPHDKLVFQYDGAWANSPVAMSLSHSLPLQQAAFTDEQCRPFFEGVLPEGKVREIISRLFHISIQNDFALLSRIGEECAGAVSLVPDKMKASKPGPNKSTTELSEEDLFQKIRELPRRPLMAGEEGIRISLAGVQNKLPIILAAGKYWLPQGHVPSTHILKPPMPEFAGMVENEYFCLRLAKALGLPAADAEIQSIKTINVLVIRRYDRLVQPGKAIQRLHQEDFCQALGLLPRFKYQNEGGPSAKAAFELLGRAATTPAKDRQALLKAIFFNFFIGNHDAHGKNFSLLYKPGQTTLAPLYDLVSTAVYPDLSRHMAMKIGSEYKPEKVFKRHWMQLAEEAQLNATLVLKQLRDMAKAIPAKAAEVQTGMESEGITAPIVELINQLIQHRAKKVLKDFAD